MVDVRCVGVRKKTQDIMLCLGRSSLSSRRRCVTRLSKNLCGGAEKYISVSVVASFVYVHVTSMYTDRKPYRKLQ